MTQKTLEQALRLLLSWYQKNARVLPFRGTHDPYRIWISEIMLQQTRANAVIPYYERFLNSLPDVYALAAVPDDELMKLWEGLGYYSRARNLKKCAQVFVKDCGGHIPQEYEQLIRLPGIGFYTAGAISSIAFNCPVPAVDGNVMRVMSRLNNSEENVLSSKNRRAVFEQLAEAYGAMEQDLSFGEINQAFMDLGSLVCVPGTPKCSDCPLAVYCAAHLAGEDRPSQLPVRRKAAEKRQEKRTIIIIGAGEETLLHRRPDRGLLAGLYEFPGFDGHLGEKQALQAVRSLGFEPLHIERLEDAKHVFSHIIWDMICYRVRVADPVRLESLPGAEAAEVGEGKIAYGEKLLSGKPQGGHSLHAPGGSWLWIDSREAGKSVPIPSAFAKWFPKVGIR